MSDKTHAQNGVCPNCGYCPHCGRSYQTFPYYPQPYWPWWLNQPGWPYYTQILCGDANGTITTGNAQAQTSSLTNWDGRNVTWT